MEGPLAGERLQEFLLRFGRDRRTAPFKCCNKDALLILIFLLFVVFSARSELFADSITSFRILGRKHCFITEQESGEILAYGARIIRNEGTLIPVRFFRLGVLTRRLRALRRRVLNVHEANQPFEMRWSNLSLSQLNKAMRRTRRCRVIERFNDENRIPQQVSPCRDVGANPLRVINGEDCLVADSTAVVRLDISTSTGSFLCSGVVITPQAVLTAAHCFVGNTGFSPNPDFVVSRVQLVIDRNEFSFFEASRFEVNAEYDTFCGRPTSGPICGDGDLAVVFFDRRLPFVPARLLFPDDLQDGEMALIAGFGCQDRDGDGAGDFTFGGQCSALGTLQAGYTKVSRFDQESGLPLSNGELRSYFDFSKSTGPGSTSTTCVGDSGGPLFVRRSGQWRVAGITSYGSVGCGPFDEAGYANVSSIEGRTFLSRVLPEIFSSDS